MKSHAIAVLVLALICTALSSQRGRRYARPDEFDNVPQNVRDELEARHCLVPQDPQTRELHNLVQGEFARKGQTDWAAYCSVDGQSETLVIWGGAARCEGEPFGYERPVPDNELERDWDAGQWGKMPPGGSYWKLSTLTRSEVNATQKTGGTNIPLRLPARHDALKRTSPAGTTVVYCATDKWRMLWYGD